MTPLLAVPAVLLVAALVAIWLRRRYTVAARSGGDRLMRGRAAAHVRLVSRTLLVRAAPHLVAGPVATAVGARPTLFVPAAVRPGETAAWTSTSSLTPDLPRLVVRPADTAGWTEVGVVEYAWAMRFPQGGRFVKRVLPQSRTALERIGFEVVERYREFTPPFPGSTADGLRRAVPFAATRRGNEPLTLD